MAATRRLPRVLLTSVFKPFAQDDEFGSRVINPVELYHNQVTREQGPFSLRMFHRTWSLMFLQQNISAPCTVLDFPTRERFVHELRAHRYDVVGISAIVVNAGKVREMCRLVRQHSPHSVIVVGGHVASVPHLARIIDADHIVSGEGIGWLREFLGEAADRPIVHPFIYSSFGFRVMGVRIPEARGDRAATVVPSVGCPMGCNFCTTSAFFGGKGRVVNFYERGADLFRVMCDIERALGVSSFFMMDENFLLYRRRALELLDHMKRHNKSWSLYVFSSANAIRKYDPRQLAELGVEWIWLGLEGEAAGYAKLAGTDTLTLTRELQAHGIAVLGSTIIGLEHHTPENIRSAIDYAVAHEAAFHQFMLYTPMPGTALHRQLATEKRLLDDVDIADIHGQFAFNFRHPAITREQSTALLDRAFQVDYQQNGPSLYRLVGVMFDRYRNYAADDDSRIRARVARTTRRLQGGYGAALWAMEHYLKRRDQAMASRVADLRGRLEREFGAWSGVLNLAAGAPLLWAARREAARHPRGRHLEPRTFVERTNWAR